MLEPNPASGCGVASALRNALSRANPIAWASAKSVLLISVDEAHRNPHEAQPHRNRKEQSALQRPCSYPVTPSKKLR